MGTHAKRRRPKKSKSPFIALAVLLVLIGLTVAMVYASGLRSKGTAATAEEPTRTLDLASSEGATPSVESMRSAEKPALPAGAEELPPIEPLFVESVPAAGPRVALTFDLCERDDDLAGYDEAIVDTLISESAPATFFMGGKWAESHPDAAAFLGRQELFEIGNHSWSHLDFASIDAATMSQQVVDAQDAIARLTGRTPRLFRFPFGTYSDEALLVVAEHGLPAIQWDVVTADPDPNFDAEDILRAVRNGASNGSIIIMHANERGWHTAEALPRMIDYLRGQGFELVTVSELLDS